MFEDLKQMINRENMHKIKRNQRYANDDSFHSEKDMEGSQQYSFEHEVSNRVEAFNKLIDDQHSFSLHKRQINNQNELLRLKKHHKQKQLLEQKIKMNQEMHLKETQYLHEKHQRQINILKSEIQKLQMYKKKQIKDQSIAASLKKDNKRLLDIQDENQNIIQRFLKEISSLKKDNIQLSNNFKRLQLEKENIKSQQAPELKRQLNLLQEEIIELKKIISSDQERKKQLQSTIQKLKHENDQFFRELQRKSINVQNQKDNIKQQSRSYIAKLQDENSQLKKRNQIIEESFIEHLTQTSLNLQQNLKNNVAQKSGKNTTLYLQETPIRTRSKEREKSRIRTPSPQEDPQKRQKNECQPSESQINKLKLKLQQANKKIVNLLYQKAQNNYKLTSYFRIRV